MPTTMYNVAIACMIAKAHVERQEDVNSQAHSQKRPPGPCSSTLARYQYSTLRSHTSTRASMGQARLSALTLLHNHDNKGTDVQEDNTSVCPSPSQTFGTEHPSFNCCVRNTCTQFSWQLSYLASVFAWLQCDGRWNFRTSSRMGK